MEETHRQDPAVAIGGIKLEQAREIFAAGADSIAVVSDVTQNAIPSARVARLALDVRGRQHEEDGRCQRSVFLDG